MLKTLLVDDSPVFLQAVTMVMGTLQDIDVVATCAGGEQALAYTDAHEVDLALVDLCMVGIDGIETARRLRAAHPELFIVLTSLFPSESVRQAIEQGSINQFVHKNEIFENLPGVIASCIRMHKRFKDNARPALQRRAG